MAGLLDFLMQGQAGGGLLGGGMNLPDAFGGNQGMTLAGLGLASGATPGEGFKNMLPALQQAYEQQQAQRAGMALLNAMPGQGAAPQAPPSMPAMPTKPGGLTNFGNAIAGIESKGQANPYAALGPVTASGDRAYGKYQVMGANIPAWTQEHLGQSMTPEQFLATPNAQDAVFNGQFGKYVQQTGNPQDAASMWFTGKPLAQGAGLKDQLGTSGQSYVDQFTRNLGQPNVVGANGPAMPNSGPPQQPAAAPPPQGQSPQAQGSGLPGSGLQLMDSPALQGMPDTVRKAIPVMLASKQYAPQAMALIAKYINPEQWQMWRDTMGNVIVRNNQTGESKPLITPTPDMMNAAASGVRTPLDYTRLQEENKVAAQNQGMTEAEKNARASGIRNPLDFTTAQKFGEIAAQNTALTPEQKNAGVMATGQGPGAITQFESDKANATALGTNFAKKYEGAVEGGVIAASTLPKLDMALSIVKNDPNFYSGFGENYNLAVKKIASALGLPDTGVGQQLVAKTVADQTVNAIRAFAASSPVGRVLQKEVEAITTSLGSTANTKEALLPLLQVQRNVLTAMAATADIAQNHNGGSGKLDPAYDRAVTEYLRKNPVIDAGLMEQIRAATKQSGAPGQPAAATPNPYEAEMRRRGLLQ